MCSAQVQLKFQNWNRFTLKQNGNKPGSSFRRTPPVENTDTKCICIDVNCCNQRNDNPFPKAINRLYTTVQTHLSIPSQLFVLNREIKARNVSCNVNSNGTKPRFFGQWQMGVWQILHIWLAFTIRLRWVWVWAANNAWCLNCLFSRQQPWREGLAMGSGVQRLWSDSCQLQGKNLKRLFIVDVQSSQLYLNLFFLNWFLQASSTLDASAQIWTQSLWCCLRAVWTLPFTRTGSICFASRCASCVDEESNCAGF